jgi:GxxExxY protein
MDRDQLSGKLIGCAIEVHRTLGPGLLESVYEKCLAHELRSQCVPIETQVLLPVEYKGEHLDCGFRVDLIVDRQLVVELKAVDALHAIHEAQLLTYLKLTGISTGLLINFNVELLKRGIRRFKL